MLARLKLPLLICLLTTGAALQAHAAWIEHGNRVTAAPHEQKAHHLVSDEAGGAIVAFWDNRLDTGAYDVFAQRMDRYGNPVWPADLPVCSASSFQHLRCLVADGAGGAIAVWDDFRSGNWNIYAQRFDGQGNTLWAADGVPICTASYVQELAHAASDGDGGAIIAWEDGRVNSAFRNDIYAQRISADGVTMWTADGISICTYASSLKHEPRVVADGSGGAVVVWQDTRGVADPDIQNRLICQRLTADGGMMWNGAGESINGNAGSDPYMRSHQVLSDGEGGVFVVWRAYCGSCGNIYNLWGQRMTPAGGRAWATIGNQICYLSQMGTRNYPRITSDGEGGIIVVWQDTRNAATTDDDIYGQRVNVDGSRLWTTEGKLLCNAAGNQHYPRPLNGEIGITLTWVDGRSGVDADIYLQTIDVDGNRTWQANGMPICTVAAEQYWPDLVPNSFGGVLVAWRDLRGGTYDIYAQSINRDGEYEQPSPQITAVEDIDDDEGGWVHVRVAPSARDGLMGHPDQVTGYNVWRRLPADWSAATRDRGRGRVTGTAADVLERCAAGAGAAGVVLKSAESSVLGLPPGDWESVGFHAAAQVPDEYVLAAPTRVDAVDGSTPWEVYAVTAHTAIPYNYFVSEADSGYSADNLAPAAPAAIAGMPRVDGEGVDLRWRRSPATDVAHYAVYRGGTADFVPSPDCCLGTPADTVWTDPGWCPGQGYHFRVAAVDVHGNKGSFASLAPAAIEGEPLPPAVAVSLDQNLPNPFNPHTTIVYRIAEPSRVHLRVFDATGALVMTLVDEPLPAGEHRITWDGRDATGQDVASGVYFCQLAAAARTVSRKMTVVR